MEAPDPRLHGAKIGSLLDAETWSLLVGCGAEVLEPWIALLTDRLPTLLVDTPWQPELFHRAAAETIAQQNSAMWRLARAVRASASGVMSPNVDDDHGWCPTEPRSQEVESWAARWFEAGWAVVGAGRSERPGRESQGAVLRPPADEQGGNVEVSSPRRAAAALVFEGASLPDAHLAAALESVFLFSGAPRDRWSQRAMAGVPFPTVTCWTYRDWTAAVLHTACDASTASKVQLLLRDALLHAISLGSSMIGAATVHRLGDLLDHPRDRVQVDARRLYYGAPLIGTLRGLIEATLADGRWQPELEERVALVTAAV